MVSRLNYATGINGYVSANTIYFKVQWNPRSLIRLLTGCINLAVLRNGRGYKLKGFFK